jgi:hypothetical protein
MRKTSLLGGRASPSREAVRQRLSTERGERTEQGGRAACGKGQGYAGARPVDSS